MSGPHTAYLEVSGQRIPMLPVYEGVQRDDLGNEVPTWVLWVHPDWPADVEFDTASTVPEIIVGEQFVGAIVNVELTLKEGRTVIPRHPG